MKHPDILYKDFLVSNQEFSLIPVDDYPGLLRTSPTPKIDDLEKYYKSEDYISHTNKVTNLMSWIYFQVKKFNLRKKYNLIKNANSGNKILDYGCGTGDLVRYLNENGMNAYGFEPNLNAYNIAIENNPKRISNSSDILKQEKFDVITLWHVLEHIPDLTKIIQKLKAALNPGGKLFIAVPNYKSYDASFYQNYWAAYDVPRHLWHFDQNSMSKFLDNFGMIIESKYPMLFDAFYVSILSEKYKKVPLGFIRAFGVGLLSNIKAQKTGEFSSLIYQVRHK